MSIQEDLHIFIDAIKSKNNDLVKQYCEGRPYLLNARNSGGHTVIHVACKFKDPKILKTLLAQPGIDVNIHNEFGMTPLVYACRNNYIPIVKLLLDDPRVDASVTVLDLLYSTNWDHRGYSALFVAALLGHTEVVRCLIASGKHLGPLRQYMNLRCENQRMTSVSNLVVASGYIHPEICGLIKYFEADPVNARREAQNALGMSATIVSNYFALTIFLCDDYLRIKMTPGQRFFLILKRLPMELQMMICCILQGSTKTHVLCHNSERAFIKLAKELKKNKIE
jgi:ankyrin repeat protein